MLGADLDCGVHKRSSSSKSGLGAGVGEAVFHSNAKTGCCGVSSPFGFLSASIMAFQGANGGSMGTWVGGMWWVVGSGIPK